jgi:hypothetical protein
MKNLTHYPYTAEFIEDSKLVLQEVTKAFEGKFYGKNTGIPYVYHLHTCVNILKSVGCDDIEMIVACYHHDTPEDLGTDDFYTLNKYPRAKKWTHALINKNKLPNYPELLDNPEAFVIKMVDRIANIREGFYERRILPKYFDQNLEFDRYYKILLERIPINEKLFNWALSLYKIYDTEFIQTFALR